MEAAMQWRADALRGYSLHALDGKLGEIADFYFDDRHWTIRYVVVATSNWLLGRQVLIAPSALGLPDWERGEIPVNLTVATVRASPDIDTAKPVDRQEEERLRLHYGWVPYWTEFGGAYTVGLVDQPPVGEPAASPAAPGPTAATGGEAALDDKSREDASRGAETAAPGATGGGDPHLRSAREIAGYHIAARDGEIGHVADVLVDDEDWSLRYFEVDTRNWLPGKHVLVAPRWVRSIAWAERCVRVDLPRAQIESGPPYDPRVPLDRSYERRLHNHYGYDPYWHDRGL
jgi:hypothetical protein